MLLLQLSSAQGPEECCLAVAKALQKLSKEADKANVKLTLVDQKPSRKLNTFRSLLLMLDGKHEQQLAASWTGTIQWICSSPYRPKYARKNWFIGVACFDDASVSFDSEIKFETMRSSGAGGQHVNKTESAVRATHVATGIAVKVQTERSQHANKRLALLLVSQKLAEQKQLIEEKQKAKQYLFHSHVIRGNPKRVFRGMNFMESKTSQGFG